MRTERLSRFVPFRKESVSYDVPPILLTGGCKLIELTDCLQLDQL